MVWWCGRGITHSPLNLCEVPSTCLFPACRWEGEWLDDVASEGELSTAVAGAMMAAASGGGIYTGGGRPAEGSVVTQALCAHPTRNL